MLAANLQSQQIYLVDPTIHTQKSNNESQYANSFKKAQHHTIECDTISDPSSALPTSAEDIVLEASELCMHADINNTLLPLVCFPYIVQPRNVLECQSYS